MVDTILDRILSHASAHPDEPALSIDEETMSWQDISAAILKFAGGLNQRGFVHQSRVAIFSPASCAFVVSYLGAIAAGCVAVPLPLSLREKDLSTLISDCDPAVLVAQDFPKTCSIETSKVELKLDLGGSFDGAMTASDFLETNQPLPQASMCEEDDAFNIIYSSGTTGQPKGIVHSHGMRNRQAARDIFDLDQSCTMLLSTPLYSNTTLVPMLTSLYFGAHTVLMPKFNAGKYLELAQHHCVTHTMLVPVQYSRILNHESFDNFDLSSLRISQCTSAPMTAEFKSKLIEKWPGRIIEGYGLTEGGVGAMLDLKAHPDKLNTVGRPAVNNNLYIIDENEDPVAQGIVGEIVGRSSYMMSGYWRRPETTNEFLWHDKEGNVLFRTGDLGKFDEDGFLSLQGRRKEMIISGGFNIYPIDIETILMQHEDVEEAAVIGLPSEKWGETPFAVIVLKPGSATKKDQLLNWTNGQVGRMQRLSGLAFCEVLPRSGIGKILKPQLIKEYSTGEFE